MFITAPMRYINLTVLKSDFDKTAELLGVNGFLELHSSEIQDSCESYEFHSSEDFRDVEDRIRYVTDFLGIKNSESVGNSRGLNDIGLYFDDIKKSLIPLKEKCDLLRKEQMEITLALHSIEKTKDLEFSELEKKNISFFYVMACEADKSDIESLSEKMSGNIYIREGMTGCFLIMVAKKKKWELESLLKEIKYTEISLPDTGELSVDEYIKIRSERLAFLNDEIAEIEKSKASIAANNINSINSNVESFNYLKTINDFSLSLKGSNKAVLISGWIEKTKIKKLKIDIEILLSGNYYLSIREPEEIEAVKKGELQVPVVMNNPFWLKPFESLVYIYGTPEYKTIDPTPFVAFTFLLFFGMMFGDFGQGMVIALSGVLMSLLSKKLRSYGFIVTVVGITAAFFGIVYGSVFCLEREEAKVFLQPIEKLLFGVDRPCLVAVSNENSNYIFAFTIALGLTVNLIGMIINLINGFIRGKAIKTLFSSTGGIGIALMLTIIYGILKVVIFKETLNGIFYYPLIAILIIIFIREPLIDLLTGHKLFHDGVAMWFVFSFVEIFETVLNTISNNLSFIRIGAFAFAHGILSSLAVSLAISAGGVESFGGVMVLIGFNIFLICFEGMIVAIQTLRLEYYEFFSKFFGEQGKVFAPFKIKRIKSEV